MTTKIESNIISNVLLKNGFDIYVNREEDIFKYISNISNTDSLVMVEIGCALGYSTVAFAKKFKLVYAIDNWSLEFEDNKYIETEFDKNIKHVDNIVKIKNNSIYASKDFENSSVDFVYIDGDHSYNSVCDDINVWLPKIKYNGYIGGHDYCNAAKLSEKLRNASVGFVYEAVNDLLGVPSLISNSNWIFNIKDLNIQ